ncbi:MAG: AI-2E family transporter [Oscillospiraceae bacterium]|nr:AI-2E family transporter [Oscillospiraceae bacterium]
MKRARREPIVLSQMRPFTLFLVLSGCIAFTFALIHFDDMVHFFSKVMSALGPVFAGSIFAFTLVPAADLLEKKLCQIFARPLRKHPRLKTIPRAVSSITAVLLFVGSIVLLIAVTSSQVAEGITTALDKFPLYLNSLTEYVRRFLSSDNQITKYLAKLSERFSTPEFTMEQISSSEISQKILSIAATGAAGTLSFLYDVIIGVVIAVYLLNSRDRFTQQWKKVLYALVKPRTATWIDMQISITSRTFGTAVVGKLIDSVLVGLFCFIGINIIGTPYTALIAVIIGVTNMIPYFGPIIGAIPCILLILMENPVKALYFFIFIIALQQFDANILDPRIVGRSVGLPPFWELFACLLGGGLFGIIGLIIGVPAFAVLYTIIKQITYDRLSERVKNDELTEEFLLNTLGIAKLTEESGLLDDAESDSPYLQHLILLEDIAQVPEDSHKSES